MGAGLWAAQKTVESFSKMRLKGKVVMITGGTRGLGLILTRQLIEKQAKVAICARSEEELQKVSTEFSSNANHFLAIPCDITKKEEVKQMVIEIGKKLGLIDILINDAGIIQVGPTETMKEDDYEKAIKTHFWGPFHTMNAAIPGMSEGGGGQDC